MYDVIVIGARAAGSPTAMLLARSGLKVLLVDRSKFPSDTLSTHQIQIKGTAALKRWGLYDRLLATNCPPVKQASFTFGDVTVRGKFPPLEEADAILCPRRYRLDKILVDAALEAGAEMREEFLVDGLIYDGDRLKGIRGHSKKGETGEGVEVGEKAQIIVGADGKHSIVAREMRAEEYKQKSAQTCAYYTYWEGMSLSGGELYALPQAIVGICPTNDGLTMIYTGYPITRFQEIRKNIEKTFWETIDSIPGLAERVHHGRQAERFYGTADLPAYYRQSHGPGWALVGDAGLALDPITGQGIGNAFRDAERLSKAIIEAISGKCSYEEALSTYGHQRDEETLPMYEFTGQTAAFLPPSAEQIELFERLAQKPDAANSFFGMLTGSVPVQEFFSRRNLLSILGVTGLGHMILRKISPNRNNMAG